MEPVYEGDTDALLIFCPGALTATEDYVPLLQSIQSQLRLRLWVVVLRNTEKEFLTTSIVESSFNGVLQRVKEKGFRPGELEMTNVFIGGHSLGAWEAREVALKKAQGFIQLGSRIDPDRDNLAQYPKPVLTMSGSLDGQITLAAIAKHAGEIVETEPAMGDYNTYGVKPVVIIPGMNHSQFSHGIVNYTRGDLDADIPIEVARSESAKIVAAFLAVQVEGPERAVGAQGLATLTKAVKQTHDSYRPFWTAMAKQRNDAIATQLQVAGLPQITEDNVIAIQHDFVDNFVYSKPWIDSKQEQVYITTYLASCEKYGNISNLWVKMKSCEALSLAFGVIANENSTSGEGIVLAADLNAKTLDRALALVSEVSRTKFLHHGKKLRFVEDLLAQKATTWIEGDVTFTPATDGTDLVDVQSPIILTSVQGISSRFAGMHYMKLLTVARALEWILVESFR